MVKKLLFLLIFVLLAGFASALPEDSLITAIDDDAPANDVVLLQDIVHQLRDDQVISKNYSTPYKLNSEITKDVLHDKITIFIYKRQIAVIVGVNCTAEQSYLVKNMSPSFEKLNLSVKYMISMAVKDDNLKTIFPELVGDIILDIAIDSSFQGELKDNKTLFFQDEFDILKESGEKVGDFIFDMYNEDPKNLTGHLYNTLLSTGQVATKTTFTLLSENNFDFFSEINYTGKIDINSGKIIFTVLPINYKFIIALGEIEDEIIQLDIGEPPSMIGTIKIDPSKMKFPDQPLPVEMRLQGNVYYADMVVSGPGEVTCLHDGAESNGQIYEGKYAVLITNFNDTSVTCYANGYAITKTIPEITMPIKVKEGVFDYDLVMAIPSGDNNFPDEDRDGVPDNADLCPGSKSTIVDLNGCDCDQKANECKSRQMGCIEINAVAVCSPTCTDGFKNQNEEGVDCGGICQPCDPAGNECRPVNACISGQAPLWCDEHGFIVLNCERCGCPTGFECEDDRQCYREIERKGLKCPDLDPEAGLNLEFYVRDKGFNCKSLGSEFEALDHKKYIKVDVKTTGLAKLLERYVKKKAEKALDGATLCVRWEDKSCVSTTAYCFSQEVIDEYKPKVHTLLQSEIDKRIKGAKKDLDKLSRILSILTLSYSKVKVKVKADFSSISQASLEKSYACDSIRITPALGCKKIIDNGPESQKADLVFVGDEYYNMQDLEQEVRSIIDYESRKAGTTSEGLFSLSPFRENKQKFNIWIIPAYDRIERIKDPILKSWGLPPNDGDVLQVLTVCPEVDYAVVLSKTGAYRSSCTWATVPPLCLVSLSGAPYPGRLTMHELGHGIGELDDEYYTPVGGIDSANLIQAGLFDCPNCKSTQQEAEQAWGHMVAGPISYFKSCGGDDILGGSEDAVRPTFNSVMNKYYLHCPERPSLLGALQPEEDPACKYGAPFSPWHAINSEEIYKKLGRFS